MSGSVVYQLTEPITISSTKENQQIIIKNAEGTTPVLSGNIDINGSDFRLVEGKSYYSLQLPQTAKQGEFWPQFRDLYLNGERLQLAKSNEEQFKTDSEYTLDALDHAVFSENKLYVAPSLAEKFDGSPNMPELCINIEWTNRIFPVKSFGEKEYKVDLLLSGGYVTPISVTDEIWQTYQSNDGNKVPFKGRTYWFQNHLALLDEAGEFYYDDENGIIYVYPTNGTDMSSSTVSYPALEKLIVLEDSTNVTIEGLSFTGTTSNYVSEHGFNGQLGGVHATTEDKQYIIPAAAIYSKNSEYLTIQDCNFDELGGHAIFLDGKNRQTAVRNNTITDVAMSAIVLGKQTPSWSAEYEQRHITISSNDIYNVATNYLCSPAISIPRVRYLTVTHNTIKHTPYSGIKVGWMTEAGKGMNIYRTEIAYNRIEDNMYALNDGAAIYVGGANSTHSDTGLFNQIHDNYLVAGASQSSKIYDGIYLDMDSSNYDVYSNVVQGFADGQSHRPIFVQDSVEDQWGYNITVRNNFTTNGTISEEYPNVDKTPNGAYANRNVVISHNTKCLDDTELNNNTTAKAIMAAAGVIK